jgi:hypothetical protein
MNSSSLIKSRTRRGFLQNLTGAASFSLLCGLGNQSRAASSYTGRLLLNIQLTGALDVTSFADPKSNVAGRPVINNWASSAGILQAGNIPFAPFAENQKFFDKYYRDILVINGIDAQTNSHSTGILHNWSGRNSEGYPTLTALMAAVQQSDMPMPYLNFGGFASTQGISTVTQIGRLSVLQNIVEPNLAEATGKTYVDNDDYALIMTMHEAGLRARSDATATLEGAARQQKAYADALARSSSITPFADILPPTSELEPTRRVGNITSSLHQQLQVSLLAFKAGVSLAADVFERGFDTHQDHDALHAPILANVTDAIDFCWSYATELGLADRLMLVIGSDFGRTPAYNSSDGKDHWPIGSWMVMAKNATWTNRVAGLTDSGHNALKINPATLQPDSAAGVILKPAHVHKALRRHLGLDIAAVTQLFPFNSTEEVAIFG